MIRALISRLWGERGLWVPRPRTDGFRDEPKTAPNLRAQAYAELRDAENRGDARDIGKCRMRLMEATHAELIERVWS